MTDGQNEQPIDELEIFELPEGGQVKTGLLLPRDGETMPQSVGQFPEELILDRADIKRALADNFYMSERERVQPWMINQASLGKCNASANIGAMDQVLDNQGQPHTPLCDNHLYWKVNGGGDVGSSLISTYHEIQLGGVSRRTIEVGGKPYRIPGDVYNRRQLPRGVAEAADADGKLFVAIEGYLLPKEFEPFKIATASALARRLPIVWAWHVGSAGMRLRSGGYMNQGRGPGNHSNVAISAKFVDGADIVHPSNRNSWGPTADAIYGPTGTGWGERGHALVTMEDFFACTRWHDFYVVTSVKLRSDKPIL